MTRLRRFLISVFAVAVFAVSLFSVACSKGVDTDKGGEKDISSYTSDELEASASYGAFYKPDAGIGDLIPYCSDGTYYILYTREDDRSRSMRLLETDDLVSYCDKGEVFRASGISGETTLGGGCIAEYDGEQYLFYTATNDGERPSVRVAVSSDGLNSFTRKQSFVLDCAQFGCEKGFFDPDIRYDADKDRFVGVLSTYYGGRAALAFFYFAPALDAECAELGGLLYVDYHGFDALRSPSLFELDGRWYISYYAERESATGAVPDGLCGNMYYLTSPSMTEGYTACDTPLDSGVFCVGKVVKGDQTVMIGKSLGRESNSGQGYGKGANIEAHAVFADRSRLLLSYPQSYDKRFAAPIALEKSAVTVSARDSAVLADEVQEYRLSAKFRTESDTEKFGFAFGCGTENVKLTVDPRFDSVKLYCDGAVVASGYVSVKSGIYHNVDIFVEGSNYVMYIDGAAFTFRVRNTGNKQIRAFAEGGGLELADIAMYKPGDRQYGERVGMRESVDRGATIEIEEDGSYRFEARVTQDQAVDCSLAIDVDGKEVCRKAFFDGACELGGAFDARKGSIVTASVRFDTEATDYKVGLTLYKDGGRQTNIVPRGESVSDTQYALGVAVDADETDAVSAARSFGAQGKNGFVYVAGGAVDEMMPMRDYSPSGSGEYTDGQADGITVRPRSIVTTDDCMAGVAYVAIKDGMISVSVGLQPLTADDKILAMLYHNRIAVAERVIESTDEGAEFIKYDLPVVAGDRILLALRAADGTIAEAAYSFEVEKLKQREKLNTGFKKDFYTDKANAGRWVYGYGKNYDFGNDCFEFVRFDSFIGDAWRDEAIPAIEIKNGWILTENNSCDAAVGCTVENSGSYIVKIDFVGSNETETRICARVLVVGSDGRTKSARFIGDGANSSEWHAASTVSASAGDTVYVILFREGGLGYYHGAFDVNVTEV